MAYSIDLEAIAKELDFDLEDVEMLVDVFLDSAEEGLVELKDAIAQNDLESIFASSHAIKGSAANIKLDEISSLARNIENSARNNNTMDYEKEYNKLKELVESIRV
ncbi:Hpt domain-containing protein [Sulfurimonas lithotrophica]|uniref:Hpt domain-containing protein n=1 Tax=Sulfurimonas lithotrophica TaxID=2590022 RepID=A0A5P8NZ99_9BACT|nr:Hpt domain-containing protein [Sulfurimonas lithotrophica]QFR48758.1 Hpt domain-containing protein [Sulfurimonas lithotrophica]